MHFNGIGSLDLRPGTKSSIKGDRVSVWCVSDRGE